MTPFNSLIMALAHLGGRHAPTLFARASNDNWIDYPKGVA